MTKTPAILPSARSIRHLDSFLIRNLVVQPEGECDLRGRQVWFALHNVSIAGGVEVPSDAPFFESERHTLSSNPTWSDLDMSSITSDPSLVESSPTVFQCRIYTSQVGSSKGITELMKRTIDLRMMIHLGLNLRPSYIDPSLKILQDLPLDTIVLELKDGFYSTQSVALYLRSTSMLESINTGDLVHLDLNVEEAVDQFCRYVSLQKSLSSINTEIKEVREDVKERLLARERDMMASSLLEENKRRVLNLRMTIAERRARIAEMKTILIEKEREVEESAQMINKEMDRLSDESDVAVFFEKKLATERLSSESLTFILEARKVKLISQLQRIYPITKKADGSMYVIRSIPLPDNDLTSYEEESISTALGFVCHYLILFSKYTALPLRYTLVFHASKCLIRDDASLGPPAEFPLYWKGVEMYKFDTAIVLLRRNIEQLMLSENIFVGSQTKVPILESINKLTQRVLS